MSGNKIPDDLFAAYSPYPLIFVNMQGEVICEGCAREMDFRTLQAGFVWDVFYEGASIQCDSCGEEIDSAYGDPEEDSEPSVKELQKSELRAMGGGDPNV